MIWTDEYLDIEDSPIGHPCHIYHDMEFPLHRLLISYEFVEDFGIGEFLGKAGFGHRVFQAFGTLKERDTLKALWYAGMVASDGELSSDYPDGYEYGDSTP
jgi:hypothetical protein